MTITCTCCSGSFELSKDDPLYRIVEDYEYLGDKNTGLCHKCYEKESKRHDEIKAILDKVFNSETP